MYWKPRTTGSRRTMLLCFAVLMAGVCSTAALAFAGTTQTPKLGGTWSGSYTGGYAGTFTIHWTQTTSRQIASRLHGTIALSNPRGTYTITGSVNGTGIKFGAVGVGALYSGLRSPPRACRCRATGRVARHTVPGGRTRS